MLRKTILTYTIVFTFALVGCGKKADTASEGEGDTIIGKVQESETVDSNFDFSSVAGFAVVGSKTTLNLDGSAETARDVLYTYDSSGNVAEMKPSDSMQSIAGVKKIFRTPNFVIISVNNVWSADGTTFCAIYVVKNTGGKLHCLPNVFLAEPMGSSAVVQHDRAGKYVMFEGRVWDKGTSDIYRIDWSGEKPTMTAVSSLDGYNEEYTVNDAGVLLAKVAPNSGRELRVIWPDGTSKSVPQQMYGSYPVNSGEYTHCLTPGFGDTADSFFYLDYDKANPKEWIQRLKIGATGEYTIEKHIETDALVYSVCTATFTNSKATYFALRARSDQPTTGAIVHEYVNSSTTTALKKIAFVDMYDIVRIVGNDTYLYVAGTTQDADSVVVRYTISDGTFNTLLAASKKVKLADIVLDSNGTLRFVAMKKSDGGAVASSVAAAGAAAQEVSIAKTGVTQVIPLRK